MDQVFDSRTQEWTQLVHHVDFEMDEAEQAKFVIGLTPEIKSTNADLIDQIKENLNKPRKPGPPPPVGQTPKPAVGPSRDVALNQKTEPSVVTKASSAEPASGTMISGLTMSMPQSASETKSWYMKEGAITLGPYHYLTIISMIQDGTLRDHDLIRQKGETEWKTLTEVFSKEDRDQVGSLIPQPLHAVAPDRANLRKDIRRDINRVLLVSDDKIQYVVQGLDISLGGISFASLAPHFSIGQVLTCTLTHTTKDIVNVKGKVVRIQSIKSSNDEIDLLKYVLVFEQKIDPSFVTVDE